MKKVLVKKEMLTRQRLANPFSDTPMKKRLSDVSAIDLRNNYTITRSSDGYDKIRPIDPSKKY